MHILWADCDASDSGMNPDSETSKGKGIKVAEGVPKSSAGQTDDDSLGPCFGSNFRKLRRSSSASLQEQLDAFNSYGMSPTFEEPPNRYARRKSVFAEHYDPEEDEDDEGAKVVYPKTDEQRQRLGEAVKAILLFRSLDQEQMQEVLDAMFERKVQSGELVIRQGDDGDNFYVIEHGTFNIHVNTDTEKDKLVGKYDDAGSFGELALMYNMPRAATIISSSEGSLWAMNRQTFRRIVLKSAFKKRKQYEQLLEQVPMLQSLEAYERMNLADALMPRSIKDGERIIRQGDEADGMYFIDEGTVRITVINKASETYKIEDSVEKGEEVEVNKLTKGQYFGELALVTHKPRAASAYAVGNVRLAVLDVHAFERLLGPCMSIMQRNIDHYEMQLVQIFGSKANMSDLRR